MKTAMENLREMVDVNTIIGEPVEAPDGHVIIPVSRVGFGFAVGGSEFSTQGQEKTHMQRSEPGERTTQKPIAGSSHPFGGGSGGGVSITPVAFIVVGEKGIRLLNVEGSTHLYDRLIDAAPHLLERLGLRKRREHSTEDC
jgi:sporulation protein YtfJ